jgi:hypothetical protein
MIMRTDLQIERPTFTPNEPGTPQLNVSAPAAPEEPLETSLVELSALLLVVIVGIVLTFTGAIIALTIGSSGP